MNHCLLFLGLLRRDVGSGGLQGHAWKCLVFTEIIMTFNIIMNSCRCVWAAFTRQSLPGSGQPDTMFYNYVVEILINYNTVCCNDLYLCFVFFFLYLGSSKIIQQFPQAHAWCHLLFVLFFCNLNGQRGSIMEIVMKWKRAACCSYLALDFACMTAAVCEVCWGHVWITNWAKLPTAQGPSEDPHLLHIIWVRVNMQHSIHHNWPSWRQRCFLQLLLKNKVVRKDVRL